MRASGVIINKTLSSNPGYWLLCPSEENKKTRFVFVDQWATQTDYAVGEAVSVDGKECEDARYGRKIEADEIALLPAGEQAKLSAQANALIEKESVPLAPKPKLFFEDEALLALEPEFDRVARLLMERVFTLTPILLRHHDDADGITSGLIVKNAVLDFVKRANGGAGVPFPKSFLRSEWTDYAIYDTQRLLEDRSWALGFQKKPLLFLLDHGGNEDSDEAVREASSFFDVVVIDHHPPSERLPKHCVAFVNSIAAGGRSSHTTGLLCFEVARRVQRAPPGPREELLWVSLEGDHSEFRKPETRSWPHVLALEYLSQTKSSLDACEKLFSDARTLDLYYKKARTAIEDMMGNARKNTKTTRIRRADDGSEIVLQVTRLNFLKKKEFPSKSLAINEIHNALEFADDSLAVVSIGFIRDSLSFRGSKPAGALGFKANEIIERLKERFGRVIRSGGGHELAASIRFDEDAGERVLEAAVEEAKAVLSGNGGADVASS